MRNYEINIALLKEELKKRNIMVHPDKSAPHISLEKDPYLLTVSKIGIGHESFTNIVTNVETIIAHLIAENKPSKNFSFYKYVIGMNISDMSVATMWFEMW